MTPPKRKLVTLRVSPDFLKTLPAFTAPAKSKAKKPATASSGDNSVASTPVKEISRSGTPAAASGTGAADQAAAAPVKEQPGTAPVSPSKDKPVPRADGKIRKWTKRPAQFKTFSGFKVTYDKWLPVGGAPSKPAAKSKPAEQKTPVKVEV